MIRSLPSSRRYRWSFNLFIGAYFVLLFAPLVVTMILAFNDSMYPSLPWEGFTLDWFFGSGPEKFGIFNDQANLRSLAFSFRVALTVACLSTILGTCAAFLFEQENFRFKGALYFLMIAPLVIPGVILGISILMFANTVGIFIEDLTGIYVKSLVPGFWLVVLGQSSFISTIVALVVSARLKKFDRSLEEAAYNLGANRAEVLRYVTLPYLRPSILGGSGRGVSHVLRELQHNHFHRRIPGDPAHQHVHAGPRRFHAGDQRHFISTHYRYVHFCRGQPVPWKEKRGLALPSGLSGAVIQVPGTCQGSW